MVQFFQKAGGDINRFFHKNTNLSRIGEKLKQAPKVISKAAGQVEKTASSLEKVPGIGGIAGKVADVAGGVQTIAGARGNPTKVAGTIGKGLNQMSRAL